MIAFPAPFSCQALLTAVQWAQLLRLRMVRAQQ